MENRHQPVKYAPDVKALDWFVKKAPYSS